MIHSASTSTLQYFDPAKWKTKLHKISDKLHRGTHSWNVKASQSPTVLAAATEKYIRTKPTEISINSEDLTASQFANLTGIKTNRNSLQSIYSSDYAYSDSDDDSECGYYTTMASSSTSGNRRDSMHIWDSHFWHDGRKSLPAAITTAPLGKSNSLNQVSTVASSKPLTSQPLVRNRSEPPKGTCFQKGRFKIVFGQDDSNVEVKQPAPCVEWKRKRASSNPTATEL
ncbi:hypothetical protein [Parasitella parasitica]|uniref:Uncharacterized protein n=1 Tax=Parasitella parasitica TaxID=35722 RepID=A0A0B7NN52_9FUNG|nr:hypothetical protein [Parasitella parasitica]